MTSIQPANDTATASSCADMSVIELAIFMAVHRGNGTILPNEVARHLGDWFNISISFADLGKRLALMEGKGWLSLHEHMVAPTIDGQRLANFMLKGMIQVIDQGTRMLDVALMLSVLRLSQHELEFYPDDNSSEGR